MVACEKCEAWFHGTCMGLGFDGSRRENEDEFICGKCSVMESRSSGGLAKTISHPRCSILDFGPGVSFSGTERKGSSSKAKRHPLSLA